PGTPLGDDTRAFFEPRFGHDFAHVRVHADARAAESARAVNAHAYTVGNHVVLGAGQTDTRLLAHELAHVVQQTGQARPTLQRQEKTMGGPLDLKPDPCIFVPGMDDPLCGQKAVDLCKDNPGFPGCGIVCKVLGCPTPDKPTVMCPPPWRAATSKD